ncbi:hypothetical protein [Mesorhizobium sp.]|uniref:hypothetical protein n=1 Tax=Mesorhizobium sp. TaxID=1871066 RepID=UPI0025E0A6E2|nr:hypothetical protein [Mesorhizobium sp.]
MKNRIFLLLAAVAVFTGCQSTQPPSGQTSKFHTCKSFDGPFQIPASQQCPLSGYAQGSRVPTVIEGKPKAATPAPLNSKFRTCKSFNGPFQIPVSQQCPLSGYAQDSGVPVVIEGKPKAATPAP